jgi:hypothetical protein
MSQERSQKHKATPVHFLPLLTALTDTKLNTLVAVSATRLTKLRQKREFLTLLRLHTGI